MSVDGVVQAPGHPGEDPTGFEHGGWTRAWFSDHREIATASLLRAGCLLLGRRTYELFAAVWPGLAGTGDDLAERMDALPKHVVTHRTTGLTWTNSTGVSGDLAAVVHRLRQAGAARGPDDDSGTPGDILVLGSGALAQQLLRLGLVDEYRLLLHPVLLGSGKRLFGAHDHPVDLRLVDTSTTPTGLVSITWAVDRTRTAQGPGWTPLVP